MPFSLGGMSSGIDTEGIIKQLMDIEAQPITKAQREKGEYQERKKALQQYGGILADLQKTAKDLYGFRASYDDKKALSSNPAVIEAIASKNAHKGTTKIKVLQLASNHKIATDPIDVSTELPASQFDIEVGGDSRSVKFRGGSILKLKEKIDEAAGTVISVSAVNTEGQKHVVTVESKANGKSGEIKIRGDKDFLKKIGMVKGEKDEDKDSTPFIFNGTFFSGYEGTTKPEAQDGSLAVDPDGKGISVKGMLWREYTLPAETEIKKDTVLQISVDYTAPPTQEKEDEALPYKIEMGPDETTNIKGIELHGYNISRDRPLEQKKKKNVGDDIIGIGVISADGGERKEKLYKIAKDAKGIQEFPVGAEFAGKKIQKVVFYCNEGETRFSKGSLSTPVDKKGLLDPKNAISEAMDAKIKVDGVEISRGRNDGIADVIKGLTLNLKGLSEKEDVLITVDNDIDAAIKKIKTFVDAYNKYVEVTAGLTKAGKTDKLGSYEKARSESGILVGDSMLLRLSNQIKTVVGSAYPSRVEKPIHMLPQIGVSTGKVNAAWDTIKEGKLQIDEDLLRKSIVENPEGVKELFGSANGAESRVDNGFGYTMENTLDPYVRPGQNMIKSKMDSEDDSIKRKDEYIARQQDHLKNYQTKLRQKFGAMEKSVSSQKSTGNWMKQQMAGQ
jgi:flagellar hook-associated protein 2